jgi:hypothetical protein
VDGEGLSARRSIRYRARRFLLDRDERVSTLLANMPADPAVLFKEEVDDLLLEARNYLDGEPIANEEQANAVSSLLNRLRRVAKDADEARGGKEAAR